MCRALIFIALLLSGCGDDVLEVGNRDPDALDQVDADNGCTLEVNVSGGRVAMDVRRVSGRSEVVFIDGAVVDDRAGLVGSGATMSRHLEIWCTDEIEPDAASCMVALWRLGMCWQ